MEVKEFRTENRLKCGFSRTEALIKKADIDHYYKVHEPDSAWKPAIVVRDKEKGAGFKVVIESKE